MLLSEIDSSSLLLINFVFHFRNIYDTKDEYVKSTSKTNSFLNNCYDKKIKPLYWSGLLKLTTKGTK